MARKLRPEEIQVFGPAPGLSQLIAPEDMESLFRNLAEKRDHPFEISWEASAWLQGTLPDPSGS